MKKRFAIPVENDLLSSHFGHAKEFVFIDVVDNEIKEEKSLTPPPHEPGSLPRWISEMGATDVLAGGLGQKAVSILNAHNINVFTGVVSKDPKTLVEDFLKNNLELGGHQCDH